MIVIAIIPLIAQTARSFAIRAKCVYNTHYSADSSVGRASDCSGFEVNPRMVPGSIPGQRILGLLV